MIVGVGVPGLLSYLPSQIYHNFYQNCFSGMLCSLCSHRDKDSHVCDKEIGEIDNLECLLKCVCYLLIQGLPDDEGDEWKR
jgi:hypothetical protein